MSTSAGIGGVGAPWWKRDPGRSSERSQQSTHHGGHVGIVASATCALSLPCRSLILVSRSDPCPLMAQSATVARGPNDWHMPPPPHHNCSQAGPGAPPRFPRGVDADPRPPGKRRDCPVAVGRAATGPAPVITAPGKSPYPPRACRDALSIGVAATLEDVHLRIARNPDTDSRLPYLLHVPLAGGMVFRTSRGRDVVFWQSPRTRKQARPNVRVPTARAAGIAELTVVVDSHEQYPYRFATQQVRTVRRALPCGDYGQILDGRLVAAAVERKSMPDLVAS